MKSETFTLLTDRVRKNVIARILDVELDGKTQVVISNAGKKSAKQRGLQWRWNTDVAKSGIGGENEDTKDGVHLVSKYRWAIPIFIRDDEFFGDIYTAWIEMYGKDPERMRWFVDNMVHTEKFSTSQMAEFLTEFQNYYLSKGVQLTDPDELGIDRNTYAVR